MRALIGIPLTETIEKWIERIQIPLPDSDWIQPHLLAIPLFWLDEINSSDLKDLIDELYFLSHPPFTIKLKRIELGPKGQVFIILDAPFEQLNMKLKASFKRIKKNNTPPQPARLFIGKIPLNLKNKFTEFSIPFFTEFQAVSFALWEEGKTNFETARFTLFETPPSKPL
jgi:2'-5' RNA ligase